MTGDSSGRKQCDLIMKGGITSGVVYPEAVLELHQDYDFKCIGGASAGAIAAAATAAAQYAEVMARGARPREQGFAGLKALNDELRLPGKMLQLFQATGRAKPLLEVFLAALRGAHKAKGWKAALWASVNVAGALVTQVPLALLIGGALGFGLLNAFASAVDGAARAAPLLAALSVVVGACLGALFQLLGILFRVLPKQGFGICRLHVAGSDPTTRPPLTDWLFERFDEIAGVASRSPRRPLTFDDLAKGDLQLELITTNLSELRPYILPLDTHRFLFSRPEMEEYLPKYAVDHLEQSAYQSSSVEPPPGFFFLPPAKDLPVAFAVRLSLSFPVLISAVPLYSIKVDAFSRKVDGTILRLEEKDLKKNWFSDGGICSNFPIHFFDHWLPTRPTFGISLGEMPADQVSTVTSPLDGMAEGVTVEPRKAEPVHLPKANRLEAAAWRDVSTLVDLFSSIFGTMMSYRDTMQSELPGFRERIVEIRLTKDEGGLNLDMEPARIEQLAKKGAEAGQILRAFDFAEHRWVRLQVLMPPLADELEHLLLQATKFGGWPDANRPYPRSEGWMAVMQACLQTLAETAADHRLEPLKRTDPKPPVRLRATPRI